MATATITAHEVIRDEVIDQDGRRSVTYRYTWDTGRVDHIGPKTVNSGFDAGADMLASIPSIENLAAQDEIARQMLLTEKNQNPDKVAEYQPQPDFDRRLLAEMMQVPNAHQFHASYPFFQAVESRGGSNANKRAQYLGVIRAEYDLVANRYGSVSGIAWFLDDEKGQIWKDIPSDDWV